MYNGNYGIKNIVACPSSWTLGQAHTCQAFTSDVPSGCFKTSNGIYYQNLATSVACSGTQTCIQKSKLTNVPCNKNEYIEDSVCVGCPAGTVDKCVDGHIRCIPCPFLMQGNTIDGQTLVKQLCLDCPTNKFSNAMYAGSGATHCNVDCGESGPTRIGSTSDETCLTKCPAGYVEFLMPGAGVQFGCAPCPAGTYLPIAKSYGDNANTDAPHFPLYECEGDADTDSHCGTGKNHDRGSNVWTPCRGSKEDGHDFCVLPNIDINQDSYPDNECRPCAAGKASGEGQGFVQTLVQLDTNKTETNVYLIQTYVQLTRYPMERNASCLTN